MNTTLKIHTLDTDALNTDTLDTAPRTAPIRRTRAGQWDLLAVVGLLVSSGAYCVYAILGV